MQHFTSYYKLPTDSLKHKRDATPSLMIAPRLRMRYLKTNVCIRLSGMT